MKSYSRGGAPRPRATTARSTTRARARSRRPRSPPRTRACAAPVALVDAARRARGVSRAPRRLARAARALRRAQDRVGDVGWWDWPAELAARASPPRSRAARARHRDAIDYHAFKQWVLHAQWSRARASSSPGWGSVSWATSLRGHGRQRRRVDGARAVSPRPLARGARRPVRRGRPGLDAAGLRLAALARDDYGWMRRRLGYAGALFDRVRVDHLVGLFRSYSPRDRAARRRRQARPWQLRSA
ncbi:MAG: 4-alpha-glucanotransferase [Myxococcales bacterium]|nr:4-alpha-glucanotransferase [Myxococcales bacterium]